jgi:hypothetical protein
MKLCFITKNKFYTNKNYFVCKGFLWPKPDEILGFKFEEIGKTIEKLIFIGFKTNEKFDGYFMTKALKMESLLLVLILERRNGIF